MGRYMKVIALYFRIFAIREWRITHEHPDGNYPPIFGTIGRNRVLPPRGLTPALQQGLAKLLLSFPFVLQGFHRDSCCAFVARYACAA